MKNLFSFLLVLSAIFCCINKSSAQTTVPGGNVSGIWTLAGSPYQVQGSIMVPDGQTLTIEPGVTVEFQGHYKLYVQGRVLAIGTVSDTITFTAQDTTIGWKGIRFDNTPTTNDSSKFVYCKIQYGKATVSPDNNGGALYFNNFSKAIISDCTITNCFANTNGAGIYGTYSSPIIINNYISNNTTSGYGGAGLFFNNSQPLIFMNMFVNNEATDAYGRGGALSCYSCTGAIIDSNTFIGNIAFRGGSIFCSSGSATITNNFCTNNIALFGAGICLEFSNPIIYKNYFSNNNGDVIYCEGTNPTISNNDISNNSGIGIVCGINNGVSIPLITNNIIHNNNGGGISCHISSPIISYNFITNNTALNGGAIKCTNNTMPLIVSNNVISNNFSDSFGGAVYCSNSSPSFLNNTITYNFAIKGGALYCTDSSNPILRNNILWGNTATTSGPQVYLFTEDSDPNIYYSNIQGGSAAFGTNDVFYTGTYHNNIDSDPLFVAPTAGSGNTYDGTIADWSLQSGSPCINAGTPDTTGLYLPSTDIAENPRVSDGRIDIGAYEHLPTSIINSTTDDFINIYPNPNNGNFILNFENSNNKDLIVKIYDITGQIVFNKIYKGKANLKENIDISYLDSGVYYIKISEGNTSVNKSIVICK